jgi:DNA repair protein RecN (Recombination protein N)
MLTLLNISNIALIDALRVEFEPGLNLLTGETGSGKSIIVDALGVLIGGRFTSDLLKTGSNRGSIEGMFHVGSNSELESVLVEAGINFEPGPGIELIIRREISANGRNKIFVNNQLATSALLRGLRPFLVDIHGQGDQQTLFEPATHLQLLDSFAGASRLREDVSAAHRRWSNLKSQMEQAHGSDAHRLQLADLLRFQIQELQRARLAQGEDGSLDEERRRLMSVEKLRTLCGEAFALIYDDKDSAYSRIKQAARRVEELSTYESSFADYPEGLEAAGSNLEDLAFKLRDFVEKVESSPERLLEIEDRLADLARLKRKYGGSIQTALDHLALSEARLREVENSVEDEAQIRADLKVARADYVGCAQKLHALRVGSSKELQRMVERELSEVAMENGKLQVKITSPSQSELESEEASRSLGASGFDQVEFHFSANPGEPLKPLAKVASGGEASRLMLVLKTIAGATEFPRTIVFDEIDTGIGGRVSEAVGAKLKRLSETNQVLCVTHQPQIARFADSHLLVQKSATAARTRVALEKLDRRGRVEELARMLTGAEITESARRHARELLKS